METYIAVVPRPQQRRRIEACFVEAPPLEFFCYRVALQCARLRRHQAVAEFVEIAFRCYGAKYFQARSDSLVLTGIQIMQFIDIFFSQSHVYSPQRHSGKREDSVRKPDSAQCKSWPRDPSAPDSSCKMRAAAVVLPRSSRFRAPPSCCFRTACSSEGVRIFGEC